MTQPEIRFNGFSDEWVDAKLGDVLKVPEKVEATVTNNEQLLTVKLHGGGVHVMSSNKLLKLGSTKYYMRKAGQLIYGKQNFFNGSMAIIPLELDGKASSSFVPSLDIVNVNPVYLYQKISQPEFYKRTENWASGTGSKLIHEKTLQQFPIQLPTLPEQQKIGALFSKYDAIIALREQKLAELNALKKGMLQQMFPKNGAKVPELRFAGFADDWEERKLGSELTLLKDGTHGSHQNVLEGPFLLSAKNIKNGKVIIDEITDRKISVEEYNSIHKKFSLEKGDVLLTIVGSIGETAIIENPTGITFQRSVAYLRPSHTILSQFLFTIINGQKFQMELKKRQVVSAQPGVYLGDLSIIPVLIPSLSEQQKIGQLFKHLDARISNEQSKIEQLKAQKQGLLQKMIS